MEKVLPYAKFVVSIIGAGITSALSLATPDAPEFKYLTIASAIVTAILVYAVPNRTVDSGPVARG